MPPSKATFPHTWFEEAGPPIADDSRSNTALQTPSDNRAQAAPTEIMRETLDPSRRNSFDFVVTKFNEQEAAMSSANLAMAGQQVAYPATAALVGHRDIVSDAGSSEVGRPQSTGASPRNLMRPVGSETIELRDLPWHSVSHHSLKEIALPPMARLPRK